MHHTILSLPDRYGTCRMVASFAVVLTMTTTLNADENFPGLTPEVDEESVRAAYKEPSYSPYAGRNFPTQVYFGDTHVHTDNSLDAKGFGATSRTGRRRFDSHAAKR